MNFRLSTGNISKERAIEVGALAPEAAFTGIGVREIVYELDAELVTALRISLPSILTSLRTRRRPGAMSAIWRARSRRPMGSQANRLTAHDERRGLRVGSR